MSSADRSVAEGEVGLKIGQVGSSVGKKGGSEFRENLQSSRKR